MHKSINWPLLLCYLTYQSFDILDLRQIANVVAVSIAVKFLTSVAELLLV